MRYQYSLGVWITVDDHRVRNVYSPQKYIVPIVAWLEHNLWSGSPPTSPQRLSSPFSKKQYSGLRISVHMELHCLVSQYW